MRYPSLIRLRTTPVLATLMLAASGLALPAQGADLWEVYQAARANDPVIGGAEANYQARLQGLPQARSQLLPLVGAEASVTKSRREQGSSEVDFTSTSAQLRLVQPLFNAERWYGYQAARARTDQAELDYLSQEQGLILRVAEAYLNVLRAQDLLESSQAEEAAVRRQLEQVQQRFDVGLVAITDVLESTAVYDNTLVRVIQAEGDHGTFFETLRTLTGTSYPALGRFSANLPVTEPDPMDEEFWVDLAMRNNPSILSAREQLTAAERDSQARRAGHLPSLSASLSYGYSDTSTDNTIANLLGGSDTHTYSGGLVLSVPIYQGGLTQSRVREARYRELEAQERLREREYAVTRDTRNLFRSVLTDVQRVHARERSIRSSESALEATQTGYEVGTRNIVEVLQAQQRLYQAQFDYADSRYRYLLNMLRLLQSAGTLEAEQLAALNQYVDPDNLVPRVPMRSRN